MEYLRMVRDASRAALAPALNTYVSCESFLLVHEQAFHRYGNDRAHYIQFI